LREVEGEGAREGARERGSEGAREEKKKEGRRNQQIQRQGWSESRRSRYEKFI
jgi:hypothetical protein